MPKIIRKIKEKKGCFFFLCKICVKSVTTVFLEPWTYDTASQIMNEIININKVIVNYHSLLLHLDHSVSFGKKCADFSA